MGPLRYKTTRCPRPGFTLIELLVVISIIGILMGLVAGGVFQYLEVQTQANTESNIRAVDKVLRQQIDAVISTADKQPLPPPVVRLATNNGTVTDSQQKRARVIWRTLSLVQEFPMTYAEALSPTGASGIAASPTYGNLAGYLPGNKLYKNALTTAKGFGALGSAGESATLLLLALQLNRGGVRLSADDLSSGAADTNGDGLKELVDGWGNPLGFYRFPTGNTELDGTKPATLVFRNPLDPEGTLLNPQWNNSKNVNNPQCGAYWFQRICHKISNTSGSPISYYAPPVVASSGRDGLFGMNHEVFGVWPGPPVQMLADMSPTTPVVAPDRTYDNIYSYRLRLGARGD